MWLVSNVDLEGCPDSPYEKPDNPLQGVLGKLGSLGEETRIAVGFSFGRNSKRTSQI
jgi:hypothetical protein